MEALEKAGEGGEVQTETITNTVTVVAPVDTKHFDDKIQKLTSDHQEKDTKI